MKISTPRSKNVLAFVVLLAVSVVPVFWMHQRECACGSSAARTRPPPVSGPVHGLVLNASSGDGIDDAIGPAGDDGDTPLSSPPSDDVIDVPGSAGVPVSSPPSDGIEGLDVPDPAGGLTPGFTPGVGRGPAQPAGKRYRLVVGVITALNHFELRAAWRAAVIEPNRQLHADVLVLFVTGNQQCLDATSFDCVSDSSRANSRLIRRVETEAAEHGDLVMVDLIDVYRHLPHKLKLFYAWAVGNVEFDYMMKIDDDAFVYIDNVLPQLEHMPRQKLWWGKMRTNSGVSRQGKWAELEYSGTKYPWFAAGAGNVLSHDLVAWVGTNRDLLHNYQVGLRSATSRTRLGNQPHSHTSVLAHEACVDQHA
eukprot:TRINITY_DN1689_c0_g1_i2.p1 TRINITY_DN1689_c0_g1~~TRINITY_DN1689_c0_g1_i2.p1  ORF type:complete len:365 (+),score=105.64 TRINITY_DN1689_c0_g1_i2:196-1290(+)